MRYELTGSGMSPEKIPAIRAELKRHGARHIREAFANGWRNQPRTLRFSAPNDSEAKRIGAAIDQFNNPTGALGGGGGLIREYGLHWPEFGK